MIQSRFTVPCFLAAASVLLCIVSSAKAQGKVLLRLHLQSGQTFDQGMLMKAETARTIQNKRTDQKINQQIGFHDEVLSVGKDGTIKLKTTFQSLVFNATTMVDGKIQSVSSYDSAKHPAVIPPELRIMAAIVGQSVIITISSRGKIVKIEGIDTIAKKKTADIKVPEIVRDFTIGALKDILESTSRQSIGMLVFAKPAMRIGDSWTETISQSAFRPTQLNVKYTLISRKDGVAVISVFSAIKTSLTGTLSGTIHVDEKTGLIISSELHEYKGDKPATTSKNVVHRKPKPAADPSFTINSQATMRRWTVKLPQ